MDSLMAIKTGDHTIPIRSSRNEKHAAMIHHTTICGIAVRTGDLICTSDGHQHALFSQAYELLGTLIPGPVDHVAIYVGPGRRCIEAGLHGVIAFEAIGECWDAPAMFAKRTIADTIYGIGDPTSGRGFYPALEAAIRNEVARFLEQQVTQRRPYNLNFFKAYSLDSFYCSQLAYLAYRRHGIDLNSGAGSPELPGLGSIIFPTEIWLACKQRTQLATDGGEPITSG